MRRREEKRRKFHEAVLNTLYPPPSPTQAVDEEEKHGDPVEDFDLELTNLDHFIRTGSSSDGDNEADDDNGEGGKYQPQKLTRAQRKRLRKKKLKEDASRRSKIIGPLLPPTINEDANDNYRGDEIHRQDVRQNVDEKCDVTHDKPGGAVGCSNQNKIKNRRFAKKVAKEQLKFSGDENFVVGQSFESSNNRGNSDDDDQKMKTSNMEHFNQAQAQEEQRGSWPREGRKKERSSQLRIQGLAG
ncbi:uncharacterized protein LOC123193694 [Mangifera indica]|uniref:uncharacterized protein LOC123193694 n=1 Tax=Mangifera indica TaxID=29780 RepID=UPI001CF98108|nr:uncharacterized protein LOC123193694 [Mangifera indica]XP_044462715.1 uncharacterized protein LOC123193694 [Mangifera indica]